LFLLIFLYGEQLVLSVLLVEAFFIFCHVNVMKTVGLNKREFQTHPEIQAVGISLSLTAEALFPKSFCLRPAAWFGLKPVFQHLSNHTLKGVASKS
jgi:hypothetical protein